MACFKALLWSFIVPMAGRASAEGQIGTGTANAYQVRVLSWSEIPFRTVVHQAYDFSCGSASVATLLTYQYGQPTHERPIFGAMWANGDQPTIRRSGFSMLDIKQYLDGVGFRTEGFRLSFDNLRGMNRPGIVLLDLKGYKHFVVLKGFRGNDVLVGDPMLGLMRYTAANFESHWNGIFLTIVASPPGRQARFNLAEDWGTWATAPLDDRQKDLPRIHFTELPPLYQITAQMTSTLGTGNGR